MSVDAQEAVSRFGGGVRGRFRLEVPGQRRPPTPEAPPPQPVQTCRLSADAAFGDDAAGVEDAGADVVVPATLADDWEDTVVEEEPRAPARPVLPDHELGGQWAALNQICSE